MRGIPVEMEFQVKLSSYLKFHAALELARILGESICYARRRDFNVISSK